MASHSSVPGTIIIDPNDDGQYEAWKRADEDCPVKFYHAVPGLQSPIPGEVSSTLTAGEDISWGVE